MFNFALVLAIFASVSMIAFADDGVFVAPWFYHGLDGPKFTEKIVDNNVTARSYEAALWSSTSVESQSLKDATNIGFNRLFNYIQGENDQKVLIDMTTPVMTKVVPGAGPNCNSTFTISFYVPYIYQTAKGPPLPAADSQIVIETIKPFYVAVAAYDGFSYDAEAIAETAVLSNQVSNSKDVSVPLTSDYWFSVSYDPPFRVSNRHNEVWVPIVDTV